MNFMSVANNLKDFAILKLVVNTPELKNLYIEQIAKHNKGILTDSFPNAGFDLFVPQEVSLVNGWKAHMISMDVKAEMKFKGENTCGYYMFPRSSMSKTPLSLANHTGIIDAGYRGSLIGAFRNLGEEAYTVEKHSRLLQICHPSLCPIFVELVEVDDLSTTERGEGGFGSTGK